MEKKSADARVAYDLIQSEGGIIDGRGGTQNELSLGRSSSVEHLYEATPFGASNKKKRNKPRATKSSNNSPHIIRKFADDQQHELTLDGSGNLDDAFGDGLYAQVLDSKKIGKQRGRRQSDGNVGGVSETTVEGVGLEEGGERNDNGGNTENHRVHNGKTLVVTYHALPVKEKGKMEETICSEDIEHTVTGDATYALVQTTKKKKKKKPQERDEEGGNGKREDGEQGDEGNSRPSTPSNPAAESSEVIAEEVATEVLENGDSKGQGKNGEITNSHEEVTEGAAAATVVTTDVLKEDNNNKEKVEEAQEESAAPERKDKVTPPPKPRRSVMRKPEKIRSESDTSGASVSLTPPTPPPPTSQAGDRSARSRKSPARQAPPPPPGRAKSPPPAPPSQAPPSIPAPHPPSDPPPGAGTVSGPPSFPPPPPPLESKSPSPVPLETEDHTYAVVNIKTTKPKKVDANALIDMWLAEDAAKGCKADEEAIKKGPSETTATRTSTKKKTSVSNGKANNNSASSSSPSTNQKSVSLPRGINLRSSFNKDKMKKNPSLPPRHTPPPPPPPSGAVAPPLSSSSAPKDATVVRRSSAGNGNHTFLFSSDYASTLIKVRTERAHGTLSVSYLSED